MAAVSIDACEALRLEPLCASVCCSKPSLMRLLNDEARSQSVMLLLLIPPKNSLSNCSQI